METVGSKTFQFPLWRAFSYLCVFVIIFVVFVYERCIRKRKVAVFGPNRFRVNVALGCQYLARVPRALVTVSDFALVYKGEWLNDQVKKFIAFSCHNCYFSRLSIVP